MVMNLLVYITILYEEYTVTCKKSTLRTADRTVTTLSTQRDAAIAQPRLPIGIVLDSLLHLERCGTNSPTKRYLCSITKVEVRYC